MNAIAIALSGLFLIGAGGAIGSLSRAAIGRVLHRPGFPYGTLLVNVVGSFSLAVLHSMGDDVHPAVGHLLGVGFCGAFTTFSTFILETVLLWQAGLRLKAVTNLAATLGLCLLATTAGLCFNT